MGEEGTKIKSLSAYNLLRELILSGEALPGSRLILVDLEEKLGVGRGPIREALMRLDRSGLVQNLPNKGAIVMPIPSLEEMKLVYSTRIELETALAIDAMKYATETDLDSLEVLNLEIHSSLEGDSLMFEKDRSFHKGIYSLSRMPHIQVITDQLLDQVEIFLNSHKYGPQDKDLFLEQHIVIVNAMRNKEEGIVKKMLKKNILQGLHRVEKEIQLHARKNKRSKKNIVK